MILFGGIQNMNNHFGMRKAERKDSWTPELDQTLQDTVLYGLRQGMTQTASFAIAAKKIGKSSSACAFRFNTTIRKQASDLIKRAKSEGKRTKSSDTIDHNKEISSKLLQSYQEAKSRNVTSNQQVSLDQVIDMLQSLQSNAHGDRKESGNQLQQVQTTLVDVIESMNGLKSKIEAVLTSISYS